MITVGRVNKNKKDFINIYIGRGSPLGNPFKMNSEKERPEVCAKYESYFYNEINKDGRLRIEIKKIFRLAKDGNNINLQCYCSPKQCHGDTIKQFIEKALKDVT